MMTGVQGRPARLAHLSDLHFGRPGADGAAARLCNELLATDVDRVVVTGDITHRGKIRELQAFERAFAPLASLGRLTVTAGNHDRMGDDVAARIQPRRVDFERAAGLFIVKVDSSGPHNRRMIDCHGMLFDDDLAAIDAALARAPSGALVVLCLHHHVLPLPFEGLHERFFAWLGHAHASEIHSARELLALARGRCDLILHGHKHRPAERLLYGAEARPLLVLNAGSSTELMRARVLAHRDGALVAPPEWLVAGPGPESQRQARLVRLARSWA